MSVRYAPPPTKYGQAPLQAKRVETVMRFAPPPTKYSQTSLQAKHRKSAAKKGASPSTNSSSSADGIVLGSGGGGFIKFRVGGKEYHMSFMLGSYHVTYEGPPKVVHYFFRTELIRDKEGLEYEIVPCRPPPEFSAAGTSKMFNALPLNVQKFVTENYRTLLDTALK